jgi:transposase
VAAQKKSPIARERDEGERAAWRGEAAGIAPELFVWVDECGTRTSMTRTRARAPKGERAYGKVPRNRGPNTTLIAGMTLEGAMGASMAFEGATDKEVFEAYIGHFLTPTLQRGQIVVMDRLGAHRTKRVRRLIEARGAKLWFLPSCSPDFNPIEEAFSKVKALLKKAAARTREALLEAIAEALSAVTPEDAQGWLAHCDYGVQAQGS